MFEKISDRIYVRPFEEYSDRPNIGLIIGDRHTLLYDAGNSEKNVEQLKRELVEQGLPMPDFVAVSHWHWDHTFGMHAWGVPVIAGRLTNNQLRKVSEWKWDDDSFRKRIACREDIAFCYEMMRREYPDRSKILVTTADIVFEERLTLDLGGISCRLIHAKGPHAEDSVICYVPEEQFVFLGDSNGKDLYENYWEFDPDRDESVMEAILAIPFDRDRVQEYVSLLETLDFAGCIGGHAGFMTKKELYQWLEV